MGSTSKSINKAVKMLESGAIKDEDIHNLFMNFIGKYKHEGKSAMYFFNQNGEPHNIDKVLNNTINAVDYLKTLKYNINSESPTQHLYSGNSLAEYKLNSVDRGMKISDEYFLSNIDNKLTRRFERDILGYDVRGFTVWESDREDDDVLQSELLRKVKVKELITTLKSVDSNYTKAKNLFDKIFNETKQVLEQNEANLATPDSCFSVPTLLYLIDTS